MNKTAIKNFSIWARKKLIADAAYRAGLMGITKDGIAKALPQSTGTTEFYDIGTREPYALTGDAVMQRRRLVDTIRRKERDTDYATAYKYVLEEVAYTWFNRLIAIRFMEVNDYLPSHVRVLSSESGKLEPDLVTKPFDADLDFTSEDAEKIFRLQQENDADGLFQFLFIKQCNALHKILPGLFEMTQDVTELLFRVSVVDPEGVVYHLVHDIPEEDFDVSKGGQVEIIGWLYQYYNTEPKEQIINILKGSPIRKEDIPAATQLFTTDWVVRYIVDNTLGRYWIEHNPESTIKDRLSYYIPISSTQNDKTGKTNGSIAPEDLRIIDPCCGSGHFLSYCFDVLISIYQELGYVDRDAANSIVKNNIFGLDIDERAAQLAYFSVMMKARQYDRRFFTRNLQPNIFSAKGYPQGESYGALLAVEDIEPKPDYSNWDIFKGDYNAEIKSWNFRRLLAMDYHVVVTNPPYLNRMNADLKRFVTENYKDYSADLFSVFIYRNMMLCKPDGYAGFMTPYVWMFIPTYEKLRDYIIHNKTITSLIQMEYSAFEEATVPICSFVIKNTKEREKGSYIRLTEFRGGMDVQNRKVREALINPKCDYFYMTNQEDFLGIPGAPIAYWISDNLFSAFLCLPKMKQFAEAKPGMQTSDNNRFLRLWHEVVTSRIGFALTHKEAAESNYKWFPYNKGGDYRKWYGNIDYIINFQKDGSELKHWLVNNPNDPGTKHWSRNMRNYDSYFNRGLTWSDISSGAFSMRYRPNGSVFDTCAPMLFPFEWSIKYMALLNSKPGQLILDLMSPTIHYTTNAMLRVPVCSFVGIEDMVSETTTQNICLCKLDWDSFETSWDFRIHPLIAAIQKSGQSFEIGGIRLSKCFSLWEAECEERFQKLKANEEELNRIFIDIYGLQDELTPEVEDKDVTVRRANLGRDIRSLVSYAVGCMFGRYSLDTEGLAYAGGDWDDSKYRSFLPDADNVIPITDEGYLEDDIVARFVDFIRIVYGKESLEENLDFIAKALGNKGSTSREVIRNYFLNDFFNDHCQTYSVTGSGKRPIYWLFDSGKQNGFKALIYLHRYTPDTVGTLRVDYLHRLERVYESEIDRMQDMIDNSSNSREIAAATKRKEKLIKQLKECRDYDEKLAHLALARIALDLDDGVKVNYRKLQTAPDGKFYEVLAQSKNIMAKEK